MFKIRYRMASTKRGIVKGFTKARGRAPTNDEIVYYKERAKRWNKNK